MEECIVRVALDTPLDLQFDYLCPASVTAAADREAEGIADPVLPQVGQLVLVPFGAREQTGVVVACNPPSQVERGKLREILAIRSQLPPLTPAWLELCEFAAAYYQRPLGEVALPALPKGLRASRPVALERALKKIQAAGVSATAPASALPELNPGQRQAVDAIAASRGFASHLLFGITGSGKTEVYLHAAQRVLEHGTGQVLILVPEINLTPQLEHTVRSRFPGIAVASLHSGLAEGERLRNWLAAHLGQARIVLGTRLAVLASLPNLRLIIVDEEHDPSYKQQEGLRYSARDLAVWRARQLDIAIVLGSATPSLETWQHARSGRYRQLDLTQRAVSQAALPAVSVIDMEREKPQEGLTSTLLQALRRRLENSEQSLLFLNRRGYAPVLHCDACGWVSNCQRCSAYMVLHKPERRLRCHHCSWEMHIPRACPTCGNVDLHPLGRGTQRVEETLQHLLPEARILRIDADSTRRKGSAQAAFASVHQGEVDILVGTQMVAKGHDFKNLTLVGVLNPDTALFSHDYRASERLFSQLMQVAGRAGRAGGKPGTSEVLIQTRYPGHPLYAAVMAHDYPGFANPLLEERRQAALPPFAYQALLRAEAKVLADALAFLTQAAGLLEHPGIVINDPIPMTLTRVANLERAQLLVESGSRPALQAFLKEWMSRLRTLRSRVRWSLEVDPVDI